MTDIKSLIRYEPTSHEVHTGIYSYTEAYMERDDVGSYINRYDLMSNLNTMLANACDPGEKDALNSVLKLLGK